MLQTQVSVSPAPTDWRQVFEEAYQGRHTYDFKSGSTIPMGPQDLWIVCRGIVQLGTLFASGDEAVLGFVYPAMPFGLPLTQLNPYEAFALTDVVLMRLNQVELESSPLLAQGVLQQLSRRLQQTEAILAMISQRRVYDRLVQLLLMLKQEVGHVTPDGVRLEVRLTHQQLANLLGTTRVTITRLLGLLRQEGWLTIDRTRHFVIADAPSESL
ncbi:MULTISPECIES: Crp/Fnr family transcriptional regulator [Acaryochloris]|uniref:Transcriptional regulator, Crp/Fnr family n=1 Tax=Acaryochloris marina (strain MBIC 11017) TaxID=329726 RepID=B0BYG9_ACAM1|nr:Crp/Fnr family transcriptional regulator [Acaryochloris marina]ABW25854.1 transcriptional regulator, Crp/Fnr family [Acaryochloris marina MBIC11017]KAI9130801.1 Crp/Fnr family transcriptional regulator [Acaryochloris sp. CCMEE 5410]BDM80717.1 Crp/Fnr family transcriptional regulator [Acaryochloris marina MBIC10699]